MDPIPRETVAAEIEELRRRYRALLENEREAPSTWELSRDTLCWYVVLRDAIEPDVDVELLPDALVVRAVVGDTVVQCVLPVPRPFHAHKRQFSFQSGTLEIRLTLRAGPARSGAHHG